MWGLRQDTPYLTQGVRPGTAVITHPQLIQGRGLPLGAGSDTGIIYKTPHLIQGVGSDTEVILYSQVRLTLLVDEPQYNSTLRVSLTYLPSHLHLCSASARISPP